MSESCIKIEYEKKNLKVLERYEKKNKIEYRIGTAFSIYADCMKNIVNRLLIFEVKN